MTVELWKSVFDWVAVILVGFTFIAGAGALIAGKVLNDRQSKQLQQFETDLISAKTELGKQQERAAKAEAQIASADAASKDAVAKVAIAEARVAEASAKAESFRLDIAKANESAGQAQAQVAGATAEAARANLELARIKMPRSLNSEQQGRVANLLARFSGTNFAVVVFGDPESLALLGDIDSALQQAGWNRVAAPPAFGSDIGFNTPRGMVSQVNDVGLKVSFPPDAPTMEPIVLAVASAISAEGVPCEPHFSDRLKGTKIILISVGQKRL